MHPRLFTSLVLLDPVMHGVSAPEGEYSFHTANNAIPPTTKSSTHRRDLWPSRQAAADGLKKSKFYQKWDSRVLDRWIKYGLRDLPTALYPSNTSTTSERSESDVESGPPVTLTTPRHQEVFTFSRPNYTNDPRDPARHPPNRTTHPDLDHELTGGHPFYRPEVPQTYMRLPHVRPSVMYIFAEGSDLSFPEFRDEKLKYTGVGVGGSGGQREGRVAAHVLPDVGHLIAMEAVDKAADIAVEWLEKEMRRWREEESEFRAQWDRKSRAEKMTIDEEWVRRIPPPVRKNGGNGAKL